MAEARDNKITGPFWFCYSGKLYAMRLFWLLFSYEANVEATSRH